MTTKTLQSQIEELVSALGGAKPPTYPAIKGKFLKLARLAKTLEKGQAAAKKEARITDLEAQLENLQVELQTANREIQRLCEEEGKRQEKQQDLPDVQFEILKRLPLVNQEGHVLEAIAGSVGIQLDEAEVHLDALCKAKLAKKTYNFRTPAESVWRRTMTGNKHVLAKRLAGEEGTKASKPYKYPDLPKIEDSILKLLAIPDAEFTADLISAGLRNHCGIDVTKAKTTYLLRQLEKQDFVGCVDGTYGAEDSWYLCEKGTEYLAERDRL